MLFRKESLEGIRTGRITLAFRRWRRPSVRAGGTLLTPVGQLTIGAVKQVAESAITRADARRAGFESLVTLLDELRARPDGEIYRIELTSLREDPRHSLRETIPDDDDVAEILARLRALDGRAPSGAWTNQVLAVIDAQPGVRAGDLCVEVGMERLPFKLRVRQLKALGLTESLGTGYRLSPRGRAVLAAARRTSSAARKAGPAAKGARSALATKRSRVR